MTRPAVGAGLLLGKEMDFFSPFLFPSSTWKFHEHHRKQKK